MYLATSCSSQRVNIIMNPVWLLKVVLAKEAGLPYAALALVTDYDSWKDDVEAVSSCHGVIA